jgi:hypothetical protein
MDRTHGKNPDMPSLTAQPKVHTVSKSPQVTGMGQILQLQKTIGNRIVSQLLAQVQNQPPVTQQKVLQRAKINAEQYSFKFSITKEDVVNLQNSLEFNLYTLPKNIESRKKAFKRVLRVDETQMIKNIGILAKSYENWKSDYVASVLNPMEDDMIFLGHVAPGSLKDSMVKMVNALVDLVNSYNQIEDGTFGAEEDQEVADLSVRGGIDLGTIEGLDTDDILTKLRAATLTDRHKPDIRFNVPQHQHLNGGDMGIAFTYRRLEDETIEPYLYDYADAREGNKYKWKKARETSSGPPSIA